jgi:acetyltransferase
MQPPPVKYEWIHKDGTLVTIRPIRPEDREIELAFVRALSSNSKYFRFLSIVKDLSPQWLDRFTQVDYPREMALIATIPAETGEQEIGVARYAPGSSEDTVEFAVVVADDWQGHGIGRELLRHLFAEAEAGGHKRIEGIVLKENKKMLQLSRELGFAVSSYPGDAMLVHVVKDLRTSVAYQ